MLSERERTVNAGNAAWQLWEALPEPKIPYEKWYYGVRYQSLSGTLEGFLRGKNEPEKMED